MILDKIVAATKLRVAKSKSHKSFNQVKKESLAKASSFSYAFEESLSKPNINFICEIKRASPSRGLISKVFEYQKIALEYEKAGASALSVLTEPGFFLGSSAHLEEIKKIVSIPILRKDFIIDPYQVYESKVLGADAVILICSILEQEVLKDFFEIAKGLGMSCLVEAHNEKEIEAALKIDAKIIGVNNRNLKNFEVDFSNSMKLRKFVPNNKIFVSESGVKTKDDIHILRKNNVNAVLIGETLMESSNISEKLKELKG